MPTVGVGLLILTALGLFIDRQEVSLNAKSTSIAAVGLGIKAHPVVGPTAGRAGELVFVPNMGGGELRFHVSNVTHAADAIVLFIGASVVSPVTRTVFCRESRSHALYAASGLEISVGLAGGESAEVRIPLKVGELGRAISTTTPFSELPLCLSPRQEVIIDMRYSDALGRQKETLWRYPSLRTGASVDWYVFPGQPLWIGRAAAVAHN